MIGKTTYEAFAQTVKEFGTTDADKWMPSWEQLSDNVRQAWEAAGIAARNMPEPSKTCCVIFGVDRASGFNLEVLEGNLQAKVDDIWSNPDNYRKTGDSWDEFLKYLCVKYPDGHEARFADLVQD